MPAVAPTPSWDRASSIQTLLTVIATVVVSTIGVTHPGFTEPSWVKSLIPTASVAIAYLVHEVILHRNASKVVAKLTAVQKEPPC